MLGATVEKNTCSMPDFDGKDRPSAGFHNTVKILRVPKTCSIESFVVPVKRLLTQAPLPHICQSKQLGLLKLQPVVGTQLLFIQAVFVAQDKVPASQFGVVD